MKYLLSLIPLIIIPCCFLLQGQNSVKYENKISFIENKGQVHDGYYNQRPDVLFIAQTSSLQYIITDKGLSYQFHKSNYKENKSVGRIIADEICEYEIDNIEFYRVDFNWLGSKPIKQTVKSGQLEGSFNYYNLPYSKNNIFGVNSYGSVVLREIYPGIDVKYYSVNGQIEYDYIVSPYADYSQIKVRISGSKPYLNSSGEMVLETPLGKIIESAPVAYQDNQKVECSWHQIDNETWTFELNDIDPSKPLIIDPIVRVWGTYYGGSDEDRTYGSCIDQFNNLYLTGRVYSFNNIATSGSHQQTNSGGPYDAFLSKFSYGGSLLWATYYGGENGDTGYSCCVDSDGNVFIAGVTGSLSGISTPGSYMPNYYGYEAVFLAKFNSQGVRQWGTYYGGIFNNLVRMCRTDSYGNVFLSGSSNSTSGISTPGSHQPNHGGANWDAYLSKFSNNGSLIWGTYYGGYGDDYGQYCVVDKNDNIYLTGYTKSSDNIATTGCHQGGLGGNYDAFFVKFNCNGVRQWGTFYGGSGIEYGISCCVDTNNCPYLTGYTYSTSGISTGGSFQPSLSGDADAFLVKFNPGGVRSWATYYGSTAEDRSMFCTADINNNIYILGNTASNTGITTAGVYQETFHGGSYDTYMVKFSESGTRYWASYYGGSGLDWGSYLLTDHYNNFYITGYSSSPDKLASPGCHQNTYGGGTYDVFVAKFSDICTGISYTASGNSPVCEGESIILSCSYPTNVTCLWTGPSSFVSSQSSPVITNCNFSNAGSYTLFLTDTNNCMYDTVISIVVNTKPGLSLSNNSPVCEGTTLEITASGSGSFSWTGPDNYSGTTNNIIINNSGYQHSGTYVVVLTGSSGCTNSDSVNVQVNAPQNIDIVISYNNPVCEHSDLSISCLPDSIHSYLWSGPNGFISSVHNPQIVNVLLADSGLYYVTLTDDNGCSYTDSLNVIISSSPTVSIIPVNTQCSGNDFQIICVSDSNNTFLWSGPAGFSDIFQNPLLMNVQSANSGWYNVTVTNSNGCSGTASTQITVLSKPSSDFIYTDYGNGVLFFNNMSTNANTWSWDFGDGNTSFQQNPVHTYTIDGFYTVTLIAYNSCGTDTSIRLLYIVADINTSEALFGCFLWPNPGPGFFTISIETIICDKAYIEVVNPQGITVCKTERLVNSSYSVIPVDISNCSDGIYLFKLCFGNRVRNWFVMKEQ